MSASPGAVHEDPEGRLGIPGRGRRGKRRRDVASLDGSLRRLLGKEENGATAGDTHGVQLSQSWSERNGNDGAGEGLKP